MRLASQQGWLRRRAPTATLRLAALLNLGNLYRNPRHAATRFHQPPAATPEALKARRRLEAASSGQAQR